MREPIKFSMAYLIALIKEEGYTIKTFAEAMEMSEVSMHRKLCGKTSWTQTDIYKATQILRINDPDTIARAFLSVKK